MKKSILKVMFLAALTLSLASVFAAGNKGKKLQKPETPKVFVVINKAEWCPVCKANGERIMNEVMPGCNNLSVAFFANDLTNKKTTTQSAIALTKNNIKETVLPVKSTGVILLIDARTKKLLKEISVAKPSEEIINEIKLAQS